MQRILITSIIVTMLVTNAARAAARRELPTSVAVFFSAIEALAKADERPAGISAAANIARIKPLMQQVVDAGAKCNRAELNALYPGWATTFSMTPLLMLASFCSSRRLAIRTS